MNCEEFLFIGVDVVFFYNIVFDIFENSVLLECFLNEKEIFKVLLLWFEGFFDLLL